jgi:hypothetical protein
MSGKKRKIETELKTIAFKINLIKIYDGPKECTALCNGINDVIVEEGTKNESDLRLWLNRFLEIHTWFQFKDLCGQKLLDFYKSVIGSLDMKSENVYKFIEEVSTEIIIQHRTEEITIFLEKQLESLIVLLKLRGLTLTAQKNMDDKHPAPLEDKRKESEDLMYAALKKYSYFAVEPDEMTKKKTILLVIYLFDDSKKIDKEKKEMIRELLEIADENKLDLVIQSLRESLK